MPTAPGSTSSQAASRSLAPAAGVTPPPQDGSSYRFLSDVIMARGLVSPAAMKAALQASLAGRSLTEILVDNGELGQDDLARTLAEHHHLDHVDLEVFAVDYEAAALIEPDVARRFGAVPIALLPSGAVVVALYDPNGSTAALEFARLTGRTIQPAVASRKQIETLIETLRRGGPRPGQAQVPDAPPAPLRSVPAGDLVITTRPAAAEPVRAAAAPPVPAPPVPAPGVPAASGGIDAATALARADAAERRSREADARARAAEELARLAETRARAAEERALAAGEHAGVAEDRTGERTPAVNVARLVHACEVLERESQTRRELEAVRAALEVEHAQRLHVELLLRHPPASGELDALTARIAELERRIAGPAGEPSLEEGAAEASADDAGAKASLVDAIAAQVDTGQAAAILPTEPVGAQVDAGSATAILPAEPVAAQADAGNLAATRPAEPEDPGAIQEPAAELPDADLTMLEPLADEEHAPYVPALAPMPADDVPQAEQSTKVRRRGLFGTRKRRG